MGMGHASVPWSRAGDPRVRHRPHRPTALSTLPGPPALRHARRRRGQRRRGRGSGRPARARRHPADRRAGVAHRRLRPCCPATGSAWRSRPTTTGRATVEVLLDQDGDPLTPADQVVLYTGTDQNGTPVALDLDTAQPWPRTGTPSSSASTTGRMPPSGTGEPPSSSIRGLAGVAAPRANRYGVTGRLRRLQRRRGRAGGPILNGDGDAGDGVVLVLDALDGTVMPTGLSIDVSSVGLQPTAQILPADTDGIAWHQREVDQGLSLNGDRDQADTVVCFVAPMIGVSATTNPPAAPC